ncbi:MAG: tRNA (adenosine(37)-N6)-dimethylallyltransferase MiaA [Firmicutes bacterium]|nr:tRNA (adenosine(37)-N6)-dimethylallyltransferase MiaA [Bacillota bacterium]
MIKIVVICGPTAVGKTEYSIRLAEALDAEIVSADSMQIYKYMDIGSAKPSAEELARVRHHLIGEIDPRESFSAADYQRLASERIRDIASRGKLPVLCGGTGLYINSIVCDMDFSSPEGSGEYRDGLLREYGPEGLYERLRELDPHAADEIHPNNVKRLVRAVERLEKGEGSIRDFKSTLRPSKEFAPVMIGLSRGREELYERCDARVDEMFALGLEDELRSLLDMGLGRDDISMKGIGYKEIIECMDAGRPAREAAEKIKLNTRHLAKRQFTWLRRFEDMRWIGLSGPAFEEDKLQQMIRYASEDTQQDG